MQPPLGIGALVRCILSWSLLLAIVTNVPCVQGAQLRYASPCALITLKRSFSRSLQLNCQLNCTGYFGFVARSRWSRSINASSVPDFQGSKLQGPCFKDLLWPRGVAVE
jgi:hypothetical protein